MGGPVMLPLAAIVALLVWVAGLLAGLVALLRKTFPSEDDQPRAASILFLTFFWGIWIFGALILVAAFIFLPADGTAREAPRRVSCVNNLKMIGLAMHNYHDQYGCFPPAYTTDERGRPMHSWRVLLLQYMEQKVLYEEYDFDERWNGPHNLVPVKTELDVYRCPKDTQTGRSDTSYLMVVGPEAFSDGPGCRRLGEIADGSSNTIMVVETSQSGVHWLEPRDLDAETMNFNINSPGGNGMSSPHPEVINVLFADGTVHPINKEIDPELLRGLITIAGGEDVSQFWEGQ